MPDDVLSRPASARSATDRTLRRVLACAPYGFILVGILAIGLALRSQPVGSADERVDVPAVQQSATDVLNEPTR